MSPSESDVAACFRLAPRLFVEGELSHGEDTLAAAASFVPWSPARGVPMRAPLFAALASVLLFAARPSPADPMAPEDVPPELKPWVGWVLRGQEASACPRLPTDGTVRCAWPSHLELRLDDAGGTFTQTWRVHARSWAPLPGDAARWPQDVTAGGRPVVVTGGDPPGTWLEVGQHVLSGRFAWDALPESLRVPPETGLLSLTVRGQVVASPHRDADGRAWLAAREAAVGVPEALEMAVHRRLVDDVPAHLVTRVLLDVSGRAREVVLGPVLPEGFVPIGLEAGLPTRIEPGGKLRVQVRPGRWVIVLTAVSLAPLEAVAPPAAATPWPPDEVWAFEARPELRVVEVEGVAAIDPRQSAVPEDWKALPTYRVKPGETLRLVQRRRGDADPAPDQLAIHRTLWLDFDGNGFTVQDHLRGTLSRSSRLEMGPSAQLGHVVVDGEDQVITRLDDDGLAGVELRTASLSLLAESRIEGRVRSLEAVGWDADFHAASAMLHLPPGWRLLAARGVDDVPEAWIARWSLLDLFLALVISMAVARLWGWPWGVLALLATALTFPEPGAPRWSWLTVVALEALRRLLPHGAWRLIAQVVHLIAVATLLILVVMFSVVQVRQSLYPQLEDIDAPPARPAPMVRASAPAPMASAGAGADFRNDIVFSTGSFTVDPDQSGLAGGELKGDAGARANMERERAAALDRLRRSNVPDNVQAPAEALANVQSVSPYPQDAAQSVSSRRLKEKHDPRDVLQTGPGLPGWTWRPVALNWSGPVDRDQRVRLVLLSPLATSFLGFLRVALLAALSLRMLLPREWRPRWRRRSAPAFATPGLVVLLATAAAVQAPSARAEVPPPQVLEELRARLTEGSACWPQCASISRLVVEATPAELRLRLQVGAVASSPVALPGGADWTPQRILLDDQAAPGLLRDARGVTWILVPPGVHDVVIEGTLAGRDLVALPLPDRPHRVEVRAQGWAVTGIGDDGVPDASLQLAREATAAPKGSVEVEPAASLPPLVRVVRRIEMGLTWAVTTQVVRLGAPGSSATPAVLEIPLLPGESVTSPNVRVADGKALVNLGAGEHAVSWTSQLAEKSPLELVASESLAWVETWELDASPRWHVEASGIPPVLVELAAGPRVRQWRPWPGETLSLAVTRPEALAGATLTIDQSSLAVRPGVRATDATLELRLRTSRGGQHAIALPEGARLEAFSIDGIAQPLRQDGAKVTVPVAPGSHFLSLAFRQDDAIRGAWRSPRVDLGAPSVNANVHVTVPGNRWVLFVHGPRLGPAVLFWAVLVVVALLSALLGRWPQTPLRWWNWLLLLVGLTQVPVWAGAVVVSWLLALGWRRDRGSSAPAVAFDVVQVLLVIWTIVSVVMLFVSIRQGLLGAPRMQVVGNGSDAYNLLWYADRAAGTLPQPLVISVPLLVYRLVMLAWALWLANALLGWLRWGWGSFTSGGAWRRLRGPRVGAAPAGE